MLNLLLFLLNLVLLSLGLLLLRKKLLLPELDLTSDQKERLQRLSKQLRADLLDACQVCYYTAQGKKSRDAAMRLKTYIRKITLSAENRLPSDETVATKIIKETKNYFHAEA